MKKRGVGVVIGRFQVHKLTQGHQHLLRRALEHDKTLVCLGTSKASPSPRNPLDYPTRERMIRAHARQATVVPLPDQPTDKGWSRNLDSLIRLMYPTDPVVLYCGRDSFKDHYHGEHKVVEVEEMPEMSGTDLRNSISREVMDSEEFRAGVIYGMTNQLARIDYAVDVCLYKQDPEHGTSVLLGRRNTEDDLYRLPGGHIEPTDLNAEDAARRELAEETGLEGVDFEILDQVRITSLDAPGYCMFTTLFLAQYVHGSPTPSPGELDSLGWYSLSEAAKLTYADNHEQLLDIACATLREI